jgi:hypothetical protein
MEVSAMAPVPLPESCVDVKFDDAAANEAIRALERLEQFVRALARTRGLAVPEASHDWAGRFADDFAREFPVTQKALTGVADDIRRLVGRIHDGIEAAAAARSRRAHDCSTGGR